MYRSHIGVLQIAADALRYVGKATILSFKQTYFRQGFLMGLIFVIILALNLRVTRFWCRALCPLGALLGVVSRWSIFGLAKNPSRCDNCKRCSMHCQGGDDPAPGTKWRKSECHVCLNCVSECPKGALEYKFFPGLSETAETPNLMRRRTLAGAVAGVALLPILRSTTALKPEHDPRLLRPPGSLEEKDFLARCVRCGECMKVCPNNALHPALSEAGVEGLWTPVVVPHIGYCEPTCVLCGQACPVGAIWELTPKEKGWVIGTATDAKPVRIGTAFYDRSRCLPWAMATDCIVCEEWCPTSPKAIYLRPAEVIDAQGNVKQLRQPWVNPERCVGCGACEHACPVQDQPAVHVTSIGESRSSTNQFLLKRNRESVRS
jgi:ferredoxin